MKKVATILLVGLAVVAATMYLALPYLPRTADLDEVRENELPKLDEQLASRELQVGQHVFIRIFKESSELEVWMRRDRQFTLFKTYPICNYSGSLGPKLKEGDRQSPEGFYTVAHDQLNPNSSYHLSFNLGFPNAYDRAHGRTGSYLMVHGNCVSIGCYAMTDKGIEEIYLLVEAALKAGQKAFQVHAFPFRMTEENMARHAASPWLEYWRNLKEGYDAFGTSRIPPEISVQEKRYRISSRKD